METPKTHQLLVYHKDAKLYGEILSTRLPKLELHIASQPEEAFDFIEEAGIIFSWKIPDDLLRRAKSLVWFAAMGAGNEHLINNPYLPPTAIFTKTTVYGEMMAEYVFTYLLYSIRDVKKFFKDQAERVWDPKLPGRLRNKVLGILGLGWVGKEIAKRGKAFGMNVVGLKRNPGPIENVDQVFGPGDLKNMIPLVDYLIMILPITPDTIHFLGEEELGLLKEGATLINIGRGKTIDERALIRTLKNGKIKAILDVFEEEPLSRESELWNLENVIITPHVSGINIPEEICEGFINNYERWVRGVPLIGTVDRKRGY